MLLLQLRALLPPAARAQGGNFNPPIDYQNASKVLFGSFERGLIALAQMGRDYRVGVTAADAKHSRSGLKLNGTTLN